MAGRRSYDRFQVASPWTAAVRISRDVSVQQNPAGELVVISRTPAAVDEELTLTLTSQAGRFDLRVLVVESVPVIIDGTVRHQLKVRSAA